MTADSSSLQDFFQCMGLNKVAGVKLKVCLNMRDKMSISVVICFD